MFGPWLDRRICDELGQTNTVESLEPEEEEGPRPDGWARRRRRIASHIERSALEMIAAQGPDGVTVEQMAAAAGVSTRTFFRYFATRDDVMAALPRRQNQRLFVRVAARPPDEGVLQAFVNAVREVETEASDDDHLSLWWQARAHWPTDAPAPWMIADYGVVVAERIGAPVDDLRVAVLGTAIGHVLWVVFLRWLGSESGASLNAVVEESFRILAQIDDTPGLDPSPSSSAMRSTSRSLPGPERPSGSPSRRSPSFPPGMRSTSAKRHR